MDAENSNNGHSRFIVEAGHIDVAELLHEHGDH